MQSLPHNDSHTSSVEGNISNLKRRVSKRKIRQANMNLIHTPGSVGHTNPIESVQEVYDQTQQFIQDLDAQIKHCKRYNQVKAYRRFEMTIRDLEREVESLKRRLQTEEELKSPTKDHMREILDKLIQYQQRTKRQEEEIRRLNQLLQQKQDEIQKHKIVIIRLENKSITKHERLPSFELLNKGPAAIPSTSLLKNSQSSNSSSVLPDPPKIFDTIKRFLSYKQREHEQNFTKATKLEQLLKGMVTGNSLKNMVVYRNWEIVLAEIDRWSRQFQELPSITESDSWKVKFTLAKKIEKLNEQKRSRVNSKNHVSTQPSPRRISMKKRSVDGDGSIRLKTEVGNQVPSPPLKLKHEFLSTQS